MPRFWVLSIASNAIILGIAALSLVFMAGYGGMVSLAQAALAGFAAYMLALATLEPSTTATGSAIGFALPPIPSAVIALVLATLAGALFGAISSRSYGIYFLMLTLALAVGFFYIVLQNYDIFGGHIGFAGILGPTGQPRENPAAFYYMCLVAAGAGVPGPALPRPVPAGAHLPGNPRQPAPDEAPWATGSASTGSPSSRSAASSPASPASSAPGTGATSRPASSTSPARSTSSSSPCWAAWATRSAPSSAPSSSSSSTSSPAASRSSGSASTSASTP